MSYILKMDVLKTLNTLIVNNYSLKMTLAMEWKPRENIDKSEKQ